MKCQFIYHDIFKKCIKRLGTELVKEIFRSCKLSVCAHSNDTLLQRVFCRTIEGFTKMCEDVIVNWRKLVNCRKFHLQYYYLLVETIFINECENALETCTILQVQFMIYNLF